MDDLTGFAKTLLKKSLYIPLPGLVVEHVYLFINFLLLSLFIYFFSTEYFNSEYAEFFIIVTFYLFLFYRIF